MCLARNNIILDTKNLDLTGIYFAPGSDLAPPPLPPSSVEIWKALLAGGVAGIMSRTLTAPLEKAKIIAQVCAWYIIVR